MGYVTGGIIRQLRERKGMTQNELAERIGVSGKAVSKWETSRGLPDISIMGDLAGALGVSIAELLTGDLRENDNLAANMKKVHFYVCPVCGNVIASVGRGSFSCCGITLPEQEAEPEGGSHSVQLETVDQEYFVSTSHPMTKEHFISFVAYVTSGSIELVKLYPEQNVEVRFRKKGHGILYMYCNRHGLFRKVF